MVSGMGITGQDWDFVSGDYVYILEKAGAIPVLIPQYGDLEAAKPFSGPAGRSADLRRT